MSRKLKTQKQFIEKAREIHNNKYNYFLVDYRNVQTKVKIVCPIHGIFEQRPYSHLQGSGCFKCSKNNKLTREKFIERSKQIYNNKYDYSLVEYKNAQTKVIIICPIHGIFEQLPQNHLLGQGCRKCSIGTLTIEIFIQRAKEIHGDKYDYSKVEYINNKTKVKIFCPTHGGFEQEPRRHLKGMGCLKCYFESKFSSTEKFIEKSKQIHGDKYNYSKVEYVNSKTKVKIICKEHGSFWQVPESHLKGMGCSRCTISKGEEKIREFLESNNIKFKTQKTFQGCKYIGLLKFDFYLPENNLCIEYQGIQHYKSVKWFGGEDKFKELQEKDRIKKQYCKDNDIKLLEIRYNQFKNIDKILENNVKD